MKLTTITSAIVAIPLCLALSNVSAAPMLFFGEDLNPGGTVPAGGNAETARTDFLSNLTGVGNEDFESFANLTSLTSPGIDLSFPGSSGAITANLTGDNGGICDQNVGGTVSGITCGFSRFATSGDNYLQNASNMLLTFSEEIAAFGFYGTDFGDIGGTVTLTLTGGGSESFDVGTSLGGAANGNVLFWGIIDTENTFASIAFAATGSGGSDVFGFDDMVIGDRKQVTPVPEPSIIALFGLGLLGIGFARRRKA